MACYLNISTNSHTFQMKQIAISVNALDIIMRFGPAVSSFPSCFLARFNSNFMSISFFMVSFQNHLLCIYYTLCSVNVNFFKITTLLSWLFFFQMTLARKETCWTSSVITKGKQKYTMLTTSYTDMWLVLSLEFLCFFFPHTFKVLWHLSCKHLLPLWIQ